jgi:3-oxoacyl-[acyl-carrier protein] reductase
MANNSGRKLALITGSTGGIGRATAIALAKTGDFNLALHYNSAGEETRNKISSTIKDAAGAIEIQIGFFQADMGNYDSVRQLHALVVADIGEVDVLFNNAGANAGVHAPASLTDVPFDAFETSWRINTGSGILLTQLCLPHMEAQGWGRVIFDSSVAAFTGGVVGPHYASSKSAQHGFVHWLATNVAKKGITVNAVAPALIGGTNMMGDDNDEEVQKRIAASKCLTR